MPNVVLVPNLSVQIPVLSGVVDGFPEVKHELTTATGNAPLESGAIITDHANPKPDILELEGFVSDLTAAGTGHVTDAFQVLRSMNKESTLLTVVTPWHTYTEMLAVEIKPWQTGKGMRFSMKLEEIQRVSVAGALGFRRQGGPARERTATVHRGTVIPLSFDDVNPKPNSWSGGNLIAAVSVGSQPGVGLSPIGEG